MREAEHVARMGGERKGYGKEYVNPKGGRLCIAALVCTAMTKWVLKKFGVTEWTRHKFCGSGRGTLTCRDHANGLPGSMKGEDSYNLPGDC
jgi:hypothetical protein